MATASELSKGSCFRYKGDMLRVLRKELVAYGTHSHTKIKLFVQPVFGGGEKSLNLMHHDKVDLLDITKKSAQVIAKLPNKLQIMDKQSYETFDANANQELLNEVNEGDEVIFVDFEGDAKVIEKSYKQSQ